ncbi:MAG: GNAT family protein [Chloroflexi bacterium]|nr:GNAT family protein [Chloroflexota bacterium]
MSGAPDWNLSFWRSANTRLRAVEPSDWQTYLAWNQDDEAARRLYHIPFPESPEAVMHWTEQEAKRMHDSDSFRFVIENRDGHVVGSIGSQNCDRRAGTFSYGINIGKDHRGKGYAAEAILTILRYYFHELRYQKVTVTVYSFNQPSIRLHEKLGFTLEGQLRRMGFTNGRHFDHRLYGLTCEEFASGLPAGYSEGDEQQDRRAHPSA